MDLPEYSLFISKASVLHIRSNAVSLFCEIVPLVPGLDEFILFDILLSRKTTNLFLSFFSKFFPNVADSSLIPKNI